MKLFYTSQLSHDRQSARKAELQKKTGVVWSSYPTAGGTMFVAIWEGTEQNEEFAAQVYQALTFDYIPFHEIVYKTGLTFLQVVSACRFLAQNGYAIPTVDRMGKAAFIRKPKTFEIAGNKSYKVYNA